jgi:protein-S-isoprenylcysteine O-methyltransferase Ste14
MTVGHLVFALGMTGYLLVGMHFEERDLVRTFGDEYRAYQQRVPALFPLFPRPKGV